MIRSPFALWFVDDPANTVVDFDRYKSIVHHPICLGDVRERLKSGVYRWRHEWESDMRRVFTNAMQFNTEDSIVHGLARQLLADFDNRLSQAKVSPHKCLQTAYKRYKETLEEFPQGFFNLEWQMKEDGDPPKEVKIQFSQKVLFSGTQEKMDKILQHSDQ